MKDEDNCRVTQTLQRGCGVLLHISSLPDGNFSRSAFDFIDFLAKAGVKYWQILAAGPTGGSDSPYSPLSVFAGNPKFIDHSRVSTDGEKLKAFTKENKYWLESFVAFMEKREPETNHALLQFQYFIQWAELRKYANDRGIKIIGDVPIYTAMDSADVFGFQEQFDFGGVAGVPPDYFSEAGQLWGNPIYNWKQMARDRYKWWIARMKQMALRYDIVRIDHFRAFDTYYKIPVGANDAKTGTWLKGPGKKIFKAIEAAVPGLEIILEDLGDLTKSVIELRDQTGFPGMKVMQFGFDGVKTNEHLPNNYTKNCVGYIGTHDNDTFVGFLKSASKETRERVDEYLSSEFLSAKDATRLAIENILASKADIVILTMQDLLFQDSSHRMNTPGYGLGQWKYRISAKDLSSDLCEYLALLIERSGR